MKRAIRKQSILLLLLAIGGAVQAQSLKDALFSGRLKTQPGMIIRKGDDLSQLIDTSRTAVSADSAKALAKAKDAAEKQYAAPMDLNTMNRNNTAAAAATPAQGSTTANPATSGTGSTQTTTGNAGEEASSDATPAAPAAPEKPKDNTALWKDYMNSIIPALREEALSAKKVKKGTYYASVSYTIETDGQVTVTDVLLTPENDQLKKQIKEKITADAPQLMPVLNSSGTPRKLNRKYNFSLTKE